jgi:uncharacterized protein YcnI
MESAQAVVCACAAAIGPRRQAVYAIYMLHVLPISEIVAIAKHRGAITVFDAAQSLAQTRSAFAEWVAISEESLVLGVRAPGTHQKYTGGLIMMMTNTRLRLLLTAAGATLVVGFGLQNTARAHAYVNPREVSAGRDQDIEIRIPHGCKGSPTTEVRVKIPDGIYKVLPENNHNWKITIKKRQLPQPMHLEGGVVLTETVDEITWSGNILPDQMFERFVFRAAIPNEPGKYLFFKTIQTCKQGEVRWVAVPEDTTKLEEFMRVTPEPAPLTKIVQPERRE